MTLKNHVAALPCLGPIVTLFLASCASPGPYRTSVTPADPAHKVIEHLDDHTDLGYVELDSQGWLWYQSRAQLNAVEDLILNDSNPGHTDAPKAGVIIVAFVHGWKNNADAKDGNVISFQTTLKRLSEAEGRKAGVNRRKVVGVYVGWPGLDLDAAGLSTNKFISSAGDLIDDFSFYSRKNTGDKVGNYTGVTEILTRLETVHQRINAAGGKNPQCTYVVVGHSFGAEVVYDALSQILTQHLVDHSSRIAAVRRIAGFSSQELFTGPPRPPSKNAEVTRVTPFADLVLLVNPAFEATRYYNLFRLANEVADQGGYLSDQAPVFAIFLSEGDTARPVMHFPWGDISRQCLKSTATTNQPNLPRKGSRSKTCTRCNTTAIVPPFPGRMNG